MEARSGSPCGSAADLFRMIYGAHPEDSGVIYHNWGFPSLLTQAEQRERRIFLGVSDTPVSAEMEEYGG